MPSTIFRRSIPESFRGRWHRALCLDHPAARFRCLKEISCPGQRLRRPAVQSVHNAWDGKIFYGCEMMAQKGYIIFLWIIAAPTRGATLLKRRLPQLGRIELEDQLTGVKYLKSLAYVDPSRIGIWGWSYGGTMTLEAMFNAPDVFKAGVAVAPVSDWQLYDTIYTERYMGRPQDDASGYAEFFARQSGRETQRQADARARYWRRQRPFLEYVGSD